MCAVWQIESPLPTDTVEKVGRQNGDGLTADSL